MRFDSLLSSCFWPLSINQSDGGTRIAVFVIVLSSWCMGSASLVSDREFWKADLSTLHKVCFFNGLLYYIATALVRRARFSTTRLIFCLLCHRFENTAPLVLAHALKHREQAKKRHKCCWQSLYSSRPAAFALMTFSLIKLSLSDGHFLFPSPPPIFFYLSVVAVAFTLRTVLTVTVGWLGTFISSELLSWVLRGKRRAYPLTWVNAGAVGKMCVSVSVNLSRSCVPCEECLSQR